MKKKFLIFSSFVLIFVLSFSFVSFAEPPDGFLQYSPVSFSEKTTKAYTVYYHAYFPLTPGGYFQATQGSFYSYPNLSQPFTRVQNIFIDDGTASKEPSDRFGLMLSSSLDNPFIRYSSFYTYYFEFKISLAHSSSSGLDSQEFINKYVRKMNILLYNGENTNNPLEQTLQNQAISLSFYKLDSNYIYFRGYYSPSETSSFNKIALIMPTFAYEKGDTITCVFYDFDIYYAVSDSIYVDGDYVQKASALADTLHKYEESILMQMQVYFDAFRDRFSANNVLFLEMGNEFRAFKGLFDGILASNSYIAAFLNLSITLGALGLLLGAVAIITGKGGKRK